MPRSYVSETGDIDWLNFTPQAGHEQAEHRPALVLSPRAYNQDKPDGLLSDDDADQELSFRSGDCEYNPVKCCAC